MSCPTDPGAEQRQAGRGQIHWDRSFCSFFILYTLFDVNSELFYMHDSQKKTFKNPVSKVKNLKFKISFSSFNFPVQLRSLPKYNKCKRSVLWLSSPVHEHKLITKCRLLYCWEIDIIWLNRVEQIIMCSQTLSGKCSLLLQRNVMWHPACERKTIILCLFSIVNLLLYNS